MHKKIITVLFLIFIVSLIHSNEIQKDSNFSFSCLSKNINYSDLSGSVYDYTFNINKLTPLEKKEKIKIFDKPDFSWWQEKNRLEKMFIAIGAVSLTIGFSMFLAGLLNLVVPFDAVSIDGKPIDNVRAAYIAILSTGAGLMAAGVPFVIVGSVRLGLQKKKEKESNVSFMIGGGSFH